MLQGWADAAHQVPLLAVGDHDPRVRGFVRYLPLLLLHSAEAALVRMVVVAGFIRADAVAMQSSHAASQKHFADHSPQIHADRPIIRERLSWGSFVEASQDLARQVVTSGYKPNLIIAVARGGLVPAAVIAYRLDVKQIGTINVRHYVGEGMHLHRPVLLPPLFDRGELRRKRVLVVDDVVDSGATLCLVKNLCQHEATEVRSAVIYEKPASLIRNEYVWRRTLAWVEFPWEHTADD